MDVHRLRFAKEGNMCFASCTAFVGLEGWPGWMILKNKIGRSSIFNASGKTLKSLAKLSSLLGARIEDVPKQCLRNLE